MRSFAPSDVPCVCNSIYSLTPIFLKLNRCFCHGLKMWVTFAYTPPISFYHFFRVLNLVIFSSLDAIKMYYSAYSFKLILTVQVFLSCSKGVHINTFSMF